MFNYDIHNFSYDIEICNCAIPIRFHDICYYDVQIDNETFNDDIEAFNYGIETFTYDIETISFDI